MLPNIFKSQKGYRFPLFSLPFLLWRTSIPSVRHANMMPWSSSTRWWHKGVPSSLFVAAIPTSSPCACDGRGCDHKKCSSPLENREDEVSKKALLSTSPRGAVSCPISPVFAASVLRGRSMFAVWRSLACSRPLEVPPLCPLPTREREGRGGPPSSVWRGSGLFWNRTRGRDALLSHLSNASLLSSPLLRVQCRCFCSPTTVLQHVKKSLPLHRRRSKHLQRSAKGSRGVVLKNGKKKKGMGVRGTKRPRGKSGKSNAKRNIAFASKGSRHRTKVVSSKRRLLPHRNMFHRLHRRPMSSRSTSSRHRRSVGKDHRGKKRVETSHARRLRGMRKVAPVQGSVAWPKGKVARRERARQMQAIKKDLKLQGYPTPPGFLPYLLVHYKSKKGNTNHSLFRRAKARGNKGRLSLKEVKALNARWRRSAMAKTNAKKGRTIKKTTRGTTNASSPRSTRALSFTTAATNSPGSSSLSSTGRVVASSSRVLLQKRSTKKKKSSKRAITPARRRTLTRILKNKKKVGSGASRVRRGLLRRRSDSPILSRGQWRKVRRMIVHPPRSHHRLRFKRERGSEWKKKKIRKGSSSKSRSVSRTTRYTSSKKKLHHRHGGKKLKKGKDSVLRKHRRSKSVHTASLRKRKPQRRVLVIQRKKLRGHQLQKVKYNKRVAAIARLWRAQQQKPRREQQQQSSLHPPSSRPSPPHGQLH